MESDSRRGQDNIIRLNLFVSLDKVYGNNVMRTIQDELSCA